MGIIGKYNFDDANQRGGFIRDLIAEFPEDENRKALLEELDKFIDDIEEQSEGFESTIDSLHDEMRYRTQSEKTKTCKPNATRLKKKLQN